MSFSDSPTEKTISNTMNTSESTIKPAASQSAGQSQGKASLRDTVSDTMQRFFAELDGEQATDVYQMVLNEVEAPLLQAVMKHCRNNQSRASEVLGLNRGTLRKKLKQYDLL